MTEAEFRAAYADELSYLNLRVLGAVNAIQASTGRPNPVIIVMSDHGYTADRTDVPAQLRNLFAAFTPAAPGLLADVPTPINVMTILLNRFLGTSYPNIGGSLFRLAERVPAAGAHRGPQPELEACMGRLLFPR